VEAAAYLERLDLQDFAGAANHLGNLTKQLPEELSTSQIGVLLRSFIEVEQEANRKRQAEIARQVKSHVRSGTSGPSSSFTPALKGRAMVWDFTKGGVDPAYTLLEDNLRGSSRDGIITMFCITHRENIEVGRYSISDQPAYREKVTVGVVYWPEKTSPGSTFVWGGSPRQTRTVRYSPEYGSAVEIKEWIESLPRGTGLQDDGRDSRTTRELKSITSPIRPEARRERPQRPQPRTSPAVEKNDPRAAAPVLPRGSKDEPTNPDRPVRVAPPRANVRIRGQQSQGISPPPPVLDDADNGDLPANVPQPLRVQVKAFSLYQPIDSEHDYRPAVEAAATSALLAQGYTVAEDGAEAGALLSIGYGLAVNREDDPDDIIAALLKEQSANPTAWRSLLRTRTYCLSLHLYLWDLAHHSLIGHWQLVTPPEPGNAERAGTEIERFVSQQIDGHVDRLLGDIKLERGQSGRLCLREADQNAFSRPDVNPSRRRVWIDIDRASGPTYYSIDETFERDLYRALARSGWDCAPSPDYADCALQVRWSRRKALHTSPANTHAYGLRATMTLFLTPTDRRSQPVFSATVYAETPFITGGLSSREATARAWRQQYRAEQVWARLTAVLDRTVPGEETRSRGRQR
jgi:hypothetical protein